MWYAARDIYCCELCSVPILPGDEIIFEKGEAIHFEHTEFALPVVPEPAYV